MKGLIKWLVNNIQHPNFLLQLLQHFAKAETYFFLQRGTIYVKTVKSSTGTISQTEPLSLDEVENLKVIHSLICLVNYFIAINYREIPKISPSKYKPSKLVKQKTSVKLPLQI